MKNIIRKLKNALVKNENLICLFLISYLFIMLIPYLQLPPFWDGVSFLNHAFVTPFKDYNLAFANYGHPPLFFWLLGFLFSLFGYSNLVAHVVLFIFGSIIIFFTFKISRMLFDLNTAILTSAFLVVSPLFLATVINPNLDITVLAFLVPSYYFFIKKNYYLYAILGTCTVMSKESGILWICAIWLTFIIYQITLNVTPSHDSRSTKKKILDLFLVSIPLITLGLWMLSNKRLFGWYIYQRDNTLFSEFRLFHDSFFISMKQLFVLNFSWIVSLVLLIFVMSRIVILVKNHQGGLKEKLIYPFSWLKFEEKTILLLPIFFLFLGYLVVVAPIYDFKLPRYGILLYPFLFLFLAVVLQKLLKKELLWIFSFLFICLLFIQNFYSIDLVSKHISLPNVNTGSELEYNTEYIPYIPLEKAGFEYLQQNLSDRKIIFDWWNPMVVIDSSRFNGKQETFGYNADPSWDYLWLRDFFKQPDYQTNNRYVYVTHRINEEHHSIEARCTLTEEFYQERYGKEIWIYGVRDCQGS